MNTENQKLKYKEVGRWANPDTYAGPVIDIKASAGSFTVHFEVDAKGQARLGTTGDPDDPDGVGDPKAGWSF